VRGALRRRGGPGSTVQHVNHSGARAWCRESLPGCCSASATRTCH
jgi:hypothetical protein